MRRQGEVVPKAEILDHVWDFAFDGDDNVVEVHVSALRRKLGLGGDRDRPRCGLPDGRACALEWRSSVRSRATARGHRWSWRSLCSSAALARRGPAAEGARRPTPSRSSIDRVDEVEALIHAGLLSPVLAPTGHDVGQVQVVDASGAVVAADARPGRGDSPRRDRRAARRSGDARRRSTVARSAACPAQQYRVVARTVSSRCRAADDLRRHVAGLGARAPSGTCATRC